MKSRESDSPAQLLAQLISADWRERQEAIEALVRLDRLDLARAVLELMSQQHGNLNALSAALQVLEHIGRPLTREFCALLTNPDRELRIFVPLLLGELGGPEVVQALIAAAADDDQPENVRFNAIEALGKLRATEAVDTLAHILEQGTDFLQYAAVVALGQIGSPAVFGLLLPLLHDPRLAEPAVTALGQISERPAVMPANYYAVAAGVLAHWLESPSATGELAIQAAAALARGCPNAELVRSEFLHGLSEAGRQRLLDLPAFEQAGLLQKEDFCVDLALILGWLAADSGSERAAQVAQTQFVQLLAYPFVRQAVEASLAQMPIILRPWLLDALFEVIRSGLDAEQRYAAARLLGGTGSPAALPALRQAFESNDDILTAWAAQGLGKIAGAELAAPELADALSGREGAQAQGETIGAGEPAELLSAVDLLWLGLEHHSSFVRRSAVLALAGLKIPGMLERAEALMQQDDPRVRESALRLLTELDDRSASLAALSALADPDPNLRRVAAELLPRFTNPQVPAALDQALQSPDVGLRRVVAAVLPTAASGSLGEEHVEALLLRAVRDEDSWVRTHALRGLGRLARPAHADILANSLADPLPPVRIAAVEGLARLIEQTPDEEIRESYRRRLSEMRIDPDAGVQRAVREALGGS